MYSKIRLVNLARTALAAFALGLTAAPASAHRIDLAGARVINDQLNGDGYTGIGGCSRVTDHRVTCYSEYEDTDLDSWTQHADLVLVGSRLYQCRVKQPCTKRQKEPIRLSGRFVGRTRYGRAAVSVEMAARGAGGYFVPDAFSLNEGEAPIPCKFSDGHVDIREGGLEGPITSGRINARGSYAWDKDNDGVDDSHTVERLTGSATRSRLSAVAQLTDRYGDGTGCSGKQWLRLHLERKVPRYIEP